MAKTIKEYYTRDESQLCVDTWNSLTHIEQAQHILEHTPFRAQVIQAEDYLRHDAELNKYLNSEAWQKQLRALIKP